MTRRYAAVLAVRILAGYLLVKTVISAVTTPVVFSGTVHYLRTIPHVRISMGPLIASRVIPLLWGLMVSVLFWIWSPGIGARIFPESESADRVGAPNTRGWLTAAVLVLGSWLIYKSLYGLSFGAFSFLQVRRTAEIASGPSGDTILEMNRHMAEVADGVVRLMAGLCLLLMPRRFSALADPKRSGAGAGSRDPAFLGIRLLAVYAGVLALDSISGMISVVLPSGLAVGSFHAESVGWSAAAIGGLACAPPIAFAVLAWRLAPWLVRVFDRSSEVGEPEAAEAVQRR